MDYFNNVLNINKILLQNVISKNSIVVDATMGNGFDALFLADLVGAQGEVYAFDIQEVAVHNTKELLASKNVNNCKLLQSSHECILHHIPPEKTIAAVLFNLGFLPGGDKTICTNYQTVCATLEKLLESEQFQGIISITCYPGHAQGKEELRLVAEYARRLNQKKYNCMHIKALNQKNEPPQLILIEKRIS